jgi:hypothetical protein
VRNTLFSSTRSAHPSRSATKLAVSRPKKRDSVGTPRSIAALATFLGRLDAERGNTARDEVLQQVAVGARDLDHAAVRAGREARATSSQ